MLGAELVGLARRVQRVAEQHQAGGRQALGHRHRAHAPAERAAAEHQLRRVDAGRGDQRLGLLDHGGHRHRCPIRAPACRPCGRGSRCARSASGRRPRRSPPACGGRGRRRRRGRAAARRRAFGAGRGRVGHQPQQDASGLGELGDALGRALGVAAVVGVRGHGAVAERLLHLGLRRRCRVLAGKPSTPRAHDTGFSKRVTRQRCLGRPPTGGDQLVVDRASHRTPRRTVSMTTWRAFGSSWPAA